MSRSGRSRASWSWVLPIGLPLVLSLWTPNAGLTMAAFVTLAILVLLTWRPGEPPILLFAATYQWIQVSMKIFHADFLGVPVDALLPMARAEVAIWLSLGGLVALALGMRIAIFGLAPADPRNLLAELSALSLGKLWLAYVAIFFGREVINVIAWRFSGLTQIVLAIADLRWFFFFLFAYGVFGQRRRYGLLALALVLEVVVGFTGFFSAFKEVFFVLAIAYLTARPRFRLRTAAAVGLVSAGLIALGVLWMSVRGDYRRYVSQGESAQVVRVEFVDRVRTMSTMLSRLNRDRLAAGAELFAERAAYVDYFAKVIFRVPSLMPYEEGALWSDAIQHVLKPRLLFPDKPVLLSDSELTMKYIGEWLASDQEGTSISMGYFAESYIDFGPTWMMMPIFLVGLAWGLMYRYFLTRRTWVSYSFAAVVTVLLRANEFEIHNVKLVGGVLMTFIVFSIWMLWGIPRVHRTLLRRRPFVRVAPGMDPRLEPERG